jgi:hypothetical protein
VGVSVAGVSVTVGVGVSVTVGAGAVEAVWLAQVGLVTPAVFRVRVPIVCTVAGSRSVAVNACTPRGTISTGTPSRQTVTFAKPASAGSVQVQVIDVGAYVVFPRSVTSSGGSGGTVTVTR